MAVNYERRLKKVKTFIDKTNLDYVLITNLQNLYWLSGTGQYGTLLFPKEGVPTLFVRRNYQRALDESKIPNIIELKKTAQILDFLSKNNPSLDSLRIGMELDSLPASYYMNYQKLFNSAEILNVESDLRKLRMVKDEIELDIMRRAGITAQKAQEIIPTVLKPGIKEHQVAAEIMHTSMMNESMHFSQVNSLLKNWFILASGENLWIPSTFPVLSGSGFSNALPYCYSDRIILKGDIVMCDYAVLYHGYHSDHARTYYVEECPKLFKERYIALKNAFLGTVEDYLRDGNPTTIIYEKMKSLLEKENLDKFFQGDGYYYQGLGHGIGLELDEPPFIMPNEETILKENMVISLEPKIIIPHWGAIDLEDNFIINKGKPERITKTKYLF